jgi:hypothetical protein
VDVSVNNAYFFTTFAVAVLTLLATIYGLVRRGHKLAARFEEIVPTLERIAKVFPGRKLERRIEGLERVIDLQSQELMRLANLFQRAPLVPGGKRASDPLPAGDSSGLWRAVLESKLQSRLEEEEDE